MKQNKVMVPKSALDGLWVLLVNDQEDTPISELDGRVPVMARAGNEQTYLLGFKNVTNARKFLEVSDVANAEPRMVVKGNKSEFLKLAEEGGAVGVLVDYDPATQEYSSASSLY